MKNFHLSIDNLPELINSLQDELNESPNLIINSNASAGTGKWSLAKHFRAWMAVTGKFMGENGATMPLMIDEKTGKSWGKRKFDENDAHALFTAQWLGTDNLGNRLSWSRKGRDGMRAATEGERFNALRRHEAWAIEKGIILPNPRDSYYFRLIEEGNY